MIDSCAIRRLWAWPNELWMASIPSGPVAQLGARMNGIHEVAGSIPAWSTNSKSLILKT